MQAVFVFTLGTCIWDCYASDNNIVEPRVVAGKSRTRTSSPQAVSRRPCCAVRKTAWSGVAWARHGKCESDTAALYKSNGKDTFKPLCGTARQGNGMGEAWARHAMCESALRILKGTVATYLKVDLKTHNSLKSYEGQPKNHLRRKAGYFVDIQYGYLPNINWKEHWHYTNWLGYHVYVTSLYIKYWLGFFFFPLSG